MKPTVIERGSEPTRTSASGLQVWELVNEVSDDRDLMIAYAVIPPGTAEGPHERDTDEFIYYLAGVATIRLEDDEEIELQPGQLVRIPPGVAHSHVNHGDEPVIQLFFRAASTTS